MKILCAGRKKKTGTLLIVRSDSSCDVRFGRSDRAEDIRRVPPYKIQLFDIGSDSETSSSDESSSSSESDVARTLVRGDFVLARLSEASSNWIKVQISKVHKHKREFDVRANFVTHARFGYANKFVVHRHIPAHRIRHIEGGGRNRTRSLGETPSDGIPAQPLARKLRRHISTLVKRDGMDYRQPYKDFDLIRSGLITREQFRAASQQLGLPLSERSLHLLMDCFTPADVTNRHRVLYEAFFEFVNAPLPRGIEHLESDDEVPSTKLRSVDMTNLSDGPYPIDSSSLDSLIRRRRFHRDRRSSSRHRSRKSGRLIFDADGTLSRGKPRRFVDLTQGQAK